MLPAKGPDLPPIRLPILSPSFAPPTFPTIPSISVITSLAGSSCSCGLQCACPGCVEHRGQQHASKDFNDCADGCGTCVDHTGGVELPSGLPAPSFIDAFFARAATLPMPPPSRTASLDPTNVTVYPPQLFSGEAKEREERGAAFGLVAVPRLVCNCKGGCGCPEGQCACGDACAGCCDDKSGPVESPSIIEGTAATRDDVDALSVPRGGTIPVVANCCGGR
ncbi:hypothetical protein A0H81_00147 [Grifola frondosa]|uniref:Uncharacterized protein n=1 Tax=Grifola frondosa TaxID=5627 RepID=A0A1C7MSX2_GRIFR|nr:hypothetical protein A0H81_00147 [Grifola frondosa]